MFKKKTIKKEPQEQSGHIDRYELYYLRRTESVQLKRLQDAQKALDTTRAMISIMTKSERRA